MATKVDRGKIYQASFNSPTPKGAMISEISAIYQLSYSPFCVKIRCHGNEGQSL